MRASERMRKFHRFITMFDVVLSRFDSSSRLINFSAIERLREEERAAGTSKLLLQLLTLRVGNKSESVAPL